MPYKLFASFFLTTTIGIVLYTMYAAFHYSSNAVLGRDEANFILLSTQKILSAASIGDLLIDLFPNHGQHTLLGMQLINVFTYASFGVLDRRIMNVIGVAILCIAALLLPGKRSDKKIEVILICTTLFPLILSPAHNACIINASCTGNHYVGIATSVISLYFFTKIDEKKSHIYFAEFFMFLSVFSLAASLALIPVSLLVISKIKTENKISIMAIHLIFIICILLFHSYLTYPDTIFSFTQNASSVSMLQVVKDIVAFAITFFIIVGSLFYWLADLGHAWILIVVGLIISMLIVIAVFKSNKIVNNKGYSFHLYGVMLFLIMILMIGFGRYYSFGSSRYAVYTAFLVAMLLMVGFSHINQSDDAINTTRRIKILLGSSSLSLIYFFITLHYHQQYLLDWEQKDQFCKNLWQTEHYVCGVMIPHLEATQIIQSAIDQGIYRIEQ